MPQDHEETLIPDPNINTQPPVLPKQAEDWLKSVIPGAFSNGQSLQGHPLMQFSITLGKDQQFREAVEDISKNFQKTSVLGYEIAWVLLIWILRAWRLSKAGSWLTRIWVQAWVAVIFWWGSLFLVPWLLWGKSYQTVLATAFRAFIHQFWA